MYQNYLLRWNNIEFCYFLISVKKKTRLNKQRKIEHFSRFPFVQVELCEKLKDPDSNNFLYFPDFNGETESLSNT